MKIGTTAVAIVVPVLLFAGIALSAALNHWETESSKVPATYNEGDLAGVANPADIRGSYTFADIEKAFDVPIDALARAFGVQSEDPGVFKVKELEELYGGGATENAEIGTDSVRLFVALYRGLPYEAEETTVLPGFAVAELRALGSVPQATLAGLDERKVDIGGTTATSAAQTAQAQPPQTDSAQTAAATPAAATTVPKTESETGGEKVIKGATTFGELLQWGLTAQQIETVIGMPMGARSLSMRDFFSQKGLEFSSYKTQLQQALDTLP